MTEKFLQYMYFLLIGGGAHVPIGLRSFWSSGGNYTQRIASCSDKLGKQIGPHFESFTLSHLELCSGMFLFTIDYSLVDENYSIIAL